MDHYLLSRKLDPLKIVNLLSRMVGSAEYKANEQHGKHNCRNPQNKAHDQRCLGGSFLKKADAEQYNKHGIDDCQHRQKALPPLYAQRISPGRVDTKEHNSRSTRTNN
jgi:hypothetical protein